MTPFHFACKYGHRKIVEKFVWEKVNIHCEDSNQTTPLLLAAAEGHLEVLQL